MHDTVDHEHNKGILFSGSRSRSGNFGTVRKTEKGSTRMRAKLSELNWNGRERDAGLVNKVAFKLPRCRDLMFKLRDAYLTLENRYRVEIPRILIEIGFT
jgi:hypothetical protein